MSLLAGFVTGAGAASLGYLAVHTGRTLLGALALGGRREAERDGEVALAASRLSVPVSIVVPAGGDTAGLADAVRALACLSYPEFEVIVVGCADDGIGAALEGEWTLRPMEFFYRRSLQSAAVQRFLRGGVEDRVAVVELEEGASLSDRLNAGVNIARYRFISVVPPNVRFDADAMLRVLQPALQDPKAIAAVFSHVEDDGAAGADSRVARIHRLQSIAAQLSSKLFPADFGRAIGAHGTVTVWRKDALVDAGGFANASDPILDLGERVQARSGRVICTPQSFGWASTAVPPGSAGSSRSLHRSWPASGWPARIAAISLVVTVLVGTATREMGWIAAFAVLPVLAFGGALINVAALLVKGGGRRSPRSQELRSLLLVSPLEPFVRGSRVAPVR